MWLQLIHRDLPRLVKQRYGTELRARTLASIKPEISQALNSLLDELHCVDDGRVMRLSGNHFNRKSLPTPVMRQHQNQGYKNQSQNQVYNNNHLRRRPLCPLCKQAGRPRFDHFLSNCSYLPDNDKKFMSRTRLVQSVDDEEYEYYDHDNSSFTQSSPVSYASSSRPADSCRGEAVEAEVNSSSIHSVNRVQMKPSPCLKVFHDHHPFNTYFRHRCRNKFNKGRYSSPAWS